jgi:hypothetical protein
MKRSFLILPAIFFSLIIFPQKKNVSIRIEQENSSQSLSGQNIITLRKEPFKIIVSLNNLEGIYLFADFADSIFKLNENEKIPGFENLPGLAMAEATFNEDQELIISKDGWAFWFYDEKMDWHRFDKDIVVTTDSVVGVKTVKQFYFSEPKLTVVIEQIDQPLYLFFVAIDKRDKKGIPKKELIRLKIKINWE